MGGCCRGCARWVIGTVSICVLIAAIVGGVIVYKKEKDRDWSKLVKNNIPFIFILVAMCFAVFSALIGFLLCCCKKKCLYVTYLIIIFVVIIIEVVAIVLAFVYKDKIIDGIEENWNKDDYYKARQDVERGFKCCGFRDTDDEPGEKDCGYENKSAEDCYNAIHDDVKKNMKNLKIAAIVMGCVELVLLLCAIYLVCCNKKDDDEGIAKF